MRIALFIACFNCASSTVTIQFRPFLGNPTYGVGDSSGILFNETDNPARVLVGSFIDDLNSSTSSLSVILENFIVVGETNEYSSSVPGYFTGTVSGIDTTALGVVGNQPYMLVLKGISSEDDIIESEIDEIALFTHTSWGLFPETPPQSVPFPEILLLESSNVDTIIIGTRIENGFGDGPLIQTVSFTSSPSTPVEDRPAFDNFPDAMPIVDSGNQSGGSNDSSQAFEGWVVDPVYELLYLDETTEWVYSEALGWAYPSPSADSGIWFFLNDTRSWYWSQDSYFPYVYDDSDSSFKYLAENDGIRFLYNFSLDTWLPISE